MSKIDKIIKNLEIIKSRDSANHKEDCKCELCDSLRLAEQINKITLSGKKINQILAKTVISDTEITLMAYIEFFMEKL